MAFVFPSPWGKISSIDPDIPYNIAEASGADAHCGVLEIGPGIGPLTQQLAQRAGRVVAIELDTALLPILQETMAEYDNVTIRHGDILKQNLPELVAEMFDGLTPMVCANLPYNITTPVLTALWDPTVFRHHSDDPTGGSQAHLRPAGDIGLWGVLSLLSVSRPVRTAVRGAAGLLHPSPQGHLGGHPAHPHPTAAGGSQRRRVLVPGGACRLLHAAQDTGQWSGQRVQRSA